MEASEPIRVLVVDDHRVVREGLRSYLELVDDIEMVGEATDGRAALNYLARAKAQGGLPDVVLMDLMMEPMNGIETTAAVKERYPDIEIVAVTSFVEEEKVHAALEAGAAGYLLKDAEADEVAAAIRAAQRGEVHLGPGRRPPAHGIAAARRVGQSEGPPDRAGARDPCLGRAGQGEQGDCCRAGCARRRAPAEPRGRAPGYPDPGRRGPSRGCAQRIGGRPRDVEAAGATAFLEKDSHPGALLAALHRPAA
jgi:CheY-like chemotaxis protein